MSKLVKPEGKTVMKIKYIIFHMLVSYGNSVSLFKTKENLPEYLGFICRFLKKGKGRYKKCIYCTYAWKQKRHQKEREQNSLKKGICLFCVRVILDINVVKKVGNNW